VASASAKPNPERDVLRFGKWKYHWLGWRETPYQVIQFGSWAAFKDGDSEQYAYATTFGFAYKGFIGDQMNLTRPDWNTPFVSVRTPKEEKDRLRHEALVLLLRYTGNFDNGKTDPLIQGSDPGKGR
jgi:hypothetical protein